MYKSICGNFFLTEKQVETMRLSVEERKLKMEEYFSQDA